MKNETNINETVEQNQNGAATGNSASDQSAPPLTNTGYRSETNTPLIQESIHPVLVPFTSDPSDSSCLSDALVPPSQTETNATPAPNTDDSPSNQRTQQSFNPPLDPSEQDLATEARPAEAPRSSCTPSCNGKRRGSSPFIKGRPSGPAFPKPIRSRPRIGKVANLPDDLREWVNRQILDEVPYDEILETLTAEGHGDISGQNITNWKTGGYLEWLRARNTREERACHLGVITDYVNQNRGSIEEAALLVVANQLLEVVGDFDVTLMKAELTKDPQSYHKVIQALTRLKQVRQGSKKTDQTSLDNKASHLDPEGLLPEAERGLTEETLKKITDAIRLF